MMQTTSIWRARLATWTAWLGGGAVIGACCGVASAGFLWLLGAATQYREAHPGLVFALPLAGLVIGVVYARLGASILGGNNLVIDRLHAGGPELPLRMAPMVLLGTVGTHLFGGSAGREGTAVQMGASLADFVSHRLRLAAVLRQPLLAAGVAGGFGSVFGTPIAGAIFGLEVVVIGRLEYEALAPALVAAVVGDLTTRALGIAHAAYPAVPVLELAPLVVARWLAFGVAIAIAGVAFIELTHAIKRLGERCTSSRALRMAVGGALVVGMWQLLGTGDYLGLSLPTLQRAFTDPALPSWAFAAKLVFTAVTLGAGFLGGEVTPLFVIGATLGSVLAPVLGLPRELGAGVGMAAMFAAASNTPLALSIMAVELLGAQLLPHVALACVTAYLVTGHRSIYPAQRLWRGKLGGGPASPTALRELS